MGAIFLIRVSSCRKCKDINYLLSMLFYTLQSAKFMPSRVSQIHFRQKQKVVKIYILMMKMSSNKLMTIKRMYKQLFKNIIIK